MAIYKYFGHSWGVPAQIAGERLKEIEDRDGAITPQAVVNDARPEGSALHNVFEWDDRKAAEAYRVNQAGWFIRSVTIVLEKEEPQPVKAFFNVVRTDDGQKKTGSYINVNSALSNPESREVILSNARHEMNVFRNKYSALKELSAVFAAIDSVLHRGEK